MALTKVTYAMIEGAQVNVLDLGAVGDGSANDTAAIAAAIASLPANGGTIYFPRGTYVTDAIVLPVYPKCVNFVGDGREVSLLKPRSANQKLIESAGLTVGIGGTRFQMRHMGMTPHASGSTGMAVDMQNMSYAIFDDFAFMQNGSATFDIGFELFSQDPPATPTIGCYYNTFRDVNVAMTQVGGTLPVKQVFKIYGASGNHIIDHLTVSGTWPTTTRPAVSIDTYCRHNIVMNSNFEGLGLTGTNTVISDQGYGNYFVNNYFELTGQPYYFGAEIETSSRQWSVVEKNAFAASTIDTATTPSLVQGAVFRDLYAFGTDATVLAAIQKLRHPTYEAVLVPDTGSISLSTATVSWSIDDNRLVTLMGRLVCSGVSSPTNNVYMDLPVPAVNDASLTSGSGIAFYNTNAYTGQAVMRKNAAQAGAVYINYIDTSGNLQPTASLFKAGTVVEFCYQYYTS